MVAGGGYLAAGPPIPPGLNRLRKKFVFSVCDSPKRCICSQFVSPFILRAVSTGPPGRHAFARLPRPAAARRPAAWAIFAFPLRGIIHQRPRCLYEAKPSGGADPSARGWRTGQDSVAGFSFGCRAPGLKPETECRSSRRPKGRLFHRKHAAFLGFLEDLMNNPGSGTDLHSCRLPTSALAPPALAAGGLNSSRPGAPGRKRRHRVFPATVGFDVAPSSFRGTNNLHAWLQSTTLKLIICDRKENPRLIQSQAICAINDSNLHFLLTKLP